MWCIFPQIAGLGRSETAWFYAIKDLQGAQDFLNHPLLGSRLVEIASAMLPLEGKSVNQILGSPDDMKLRSSMTLFILLDQTDLVFQAVLATYYAGLPDPQTLVIVKPTR